MRGFLAVLRRELKAYAVTPVAYVFVVVFLVLSAVFTFYVGDFFSRGQADLEPFFEFHPWLYLVLVPAVSMRLWTEERRGGTLELLLTLPIGRWSAMLAKFFAAWLLVGLALALTFPMWLTVNYLGHPDNGAILVEYLGSLLLAGAMLSIGTCLSAATRNQVVAYILTVAVGFLYLVSGEPMIQDALAHVLPTLALNGLAEFSFLIHFQAIQQGVLDLGDIVFFLLTIVAWLTAGGVMLGIIRAD